ncbi:MAG: Eco57I restriction-modification methylase domain-containing protein, partial [Thermodesulfovibrionales bacterium]|nr:Eco57I restriction-modification methylase domain-containing protein [Thermodesulfovibrionales bacterium]
MSDIDSFRGKLQALLSKFEKDKNHYLSKGYPEAQVRIDFLNPFFKALGWDIENKAQTPPHERDVIVELSPETTGRPDYNFRIHGATKFFVEAKAPSVALDEVNHILQAKSYAWSTKEVFFVILTDFEEFKLFDASLKPNPKFSNEGLIFDFKYTDYLDKIEKLWELSRERVEQGSLEALLPRDTKSKRLRIPPDKSFLEDLTIWRTELAKDVHRRNPEFDGKLLNDVVQKLLDRIIFIRIAEDRKIRTDRELWEIVAQWKEEGKRKSIMTHLLDLFHEVNDDLNGDIFKPHACEKAEVDSNLLAEIIENLYFPKSRYRFDAIGVELLGSIYERYLGSTIRVTPQRVKVEEKPEVRKAGGVYYTPKYIVDYIVKNTVGKIIEGKTPRQIANIKILDPACGSGSFLLGAYQYLIDYHLEYYRNHPKEAQTQFFDFYYKVSPEDLALPLRTKAAILRNNIFGVDIDPQAVEITMMSLYLKALEGERGLLPKKQHLLPPLSNNIKCGNSLIGYDIFESPSPYPSRKGRGISHSTLPLDGGGLGRGWDDETKSRINPFDWNSKSTGFGEIIHPSQSPLAKGGSEGGFDVVIGNPPYVRQEMLGEFKDYFKNHYEVYQGTADLYSYFIEKGVSLLKKGGLFSYIVANKWMRANYGEPLRRWMKTQRIEEIIDFGDLPVFESATTYPCIIRIRRGGPVWPPKSGQPHRVAPTFYATRVNTLSFDNLQNYIKKHRYTVSSASLDDKGWSLVDEKAQTLLNKLHSTGIPLGEYVKGKIYYGIKTGLNEAFVIDEEKKQQLIEEDPKSKELIKPFLVGKDIKRYGSPSKGRYLILIPKGWTRNKMSLSLEGGDPEKPGFRVKPGMTETGAWKWFREAFPSMAFYLEPYAEKGKKRYDKGEHWWELRTCDYYEEFEKPKIIYAEIATRGQFIIDTTSFYSDTTSYIIPIDSKYLLGILNSALMTFAFSKISSEIRGGFYRWKRQYIRELPIRTIDFTYPFEKSLHDNLASLVDRMLELHKKKSS